jgi:acyl-CoA synthetase (AMP-forming)/AMP-acid ligase II
VGPEETAFLQLTSGSTGLPRAVMISHRAALHQLRADNESLRGREGAPASSWARGAAAWLPLYHDMGLVGCLLLPIVLGIDLWLLRPEAFLARPRLWLEAVAGAGPSYNPAPNFSFQLCVDRIREEEMAGLDLSNWRCTLNGAEMVRIETTRAFCDMFAPFGFAPEAFVPCYGMAEGTLAATIDLKGRGVRTVPAPADTDSALGVKEVACVGEPVMDTEIRIEAPDGRSLQENEVGQILIKGPSVFSGYYRDPESTAESLRDGWLITGDLGFLRDGELYITGRLKDLLIIRGQNVMPEEFERLADEVVGGGGVVRSGAFSVSRGGEGEQPVLVVEVLERDPSALPSLGQEIRRRVGHSLGLPLADLVFVRRGRLPRTTSGKIQRRELKELYLDGTLEPLAGEPA